MPFPFSECFVISCFHILTTTLNSDISRVAAYENATMSGVSVTPDTKLTLTYLVQRADVRLGSCETWAGNFVDDSRILLHAIYLSPKPEYFQGWEQDSFLCYVWQRAALKTTPDLYCSNIIPELICETADTISIVFYFLSYILLIFKKYIYYFFYHFRLKNTV